MGNGLAMATFAESFFFGMRTEEGYPSPDSSRGEEDMAGILVLPTSWSRRMSGPPGPAFRVTSVKVSMRIWKIGVPYASGGVELRKLGAAMNVVEQVLHVVAEER
jgi:hypothetical protein